MKVMSIFRLAAVMAVVAVATVVMLGARGCGSAVHKASVAAASIGASLNTAATVNHELLQAGTESSDEAAQVATYIYQAAKANDAFIATLQSVSTSEIGSTISTAKVVSAFQTLLTQINTLQSSGVLHLKSSAAQARLQVVLSSIQAEITIIQALVATSTSSWRAAPAPHSSIPPCAPLLGLTLTVEEIEELIALAVVAGSSLVSKLVSLRGQTDAQLLSTALSADAAAEKQAAADGAITV